MTDAVQNSDETVDGNHIGKKVILPSSFTGGAQYQHQLYQNAMAIGCHFEKPDFFITFTYNPHWKQITDGLLQHQTAADHQDLITQVLKLKLQSLLHDIYYGPANALEKWSHSSMLLSGKKRSTSCSHFGNL